MGLFSRPRGGRYNIDSGGGFPASRIRGESEANVKFTALAGWPYFHSLSGRFVARS